MGKTPGRNDLLRCNCLTNYRVGVYSPTFLTRKEEIMKVYNKSQRTYQHSIVDDNTKEVSLISLLPGKSIEIDDKIAKQWIATGEVVEYVDPEAAKKEKAALEAEIAKLKAEKQEIKKETKKPTKKGK